jgi:formate dehydrogenase subunit gamma
LSTESERALSAAAESAEILRFRRSERQQHWAIAVPFMVCLATAVVLFAVYNPNPTRPYRALFSWIHRLSGLCLGLLPTLTLLRHRGDFALHFRNIRDVWCWTVADVKWLLLMGPSTVNKKISLPHQGKFNAAEKINFMMLTATWPMYVLTGVLIWLPGVAFLSWLVHLTMAATAIPLIFGHIFMATVNPDTRVGLSGMFSGWVNRDWARHHYRRWYDENFPSPPRLHEPAPRSVGTAIVTRAAAEAATVDAVACAESPLDETAPWPPAGPITPAARPLIEETLPVCG